MRRTSRPPALGLQRYAQVDLVGFLIVFTCMILMRFGL